MRKYLAIAALTLSLPLLALAQATDLTASQQAANAAGDTTAANTQGAANVSSSQSYQFARQGVFGCNQTGSYAMSVGAMSAVGGVYVPVNDAAVTLNTGYLVYKECVLRGIVDRERESAVAALVKQATNNTLTGRNGNPTFYTGRQENVNRADKDNLYFLQNFLSGLNPAYKQQVTQALTRNYLVASRKPDTLPACPYTGDLQAAWSGQDTSPAAQAALTDPRCDPIFAFSLAQIAQDQYAQQGQAEMMWRLGLNNGFYDVEKVDANNQHIILTPGTLNDAVVQQAVTSGFRQTENSNDIDQMIGALFAGLGNQIISSAQGLAGLTQQIGSQPSYLDQVAAESAAGLRNSAANAAIQILSAALQVERAYNGAVTSVATTLTSTIQQLRSVENQCWGLVIQNVCATPLSAQNTCTAVTTCTQTTAPGGIGQQPTQTVCPPGPTLKVATSTQFSQQVVDSQITPLANQTVTNINSSNQALQLINQLVSGVTNTTSVDAQRVALVQLDQLVSQGALHNQTQLTTVQQQAAAIKDSMSTLLNDTKTAWGDSTDPSIGWCNVNNPSVIQMWIQRWMQ